MRKSHLLTSIMENAGFSTLTKPVNQPVGPKTMVRIKKSEGECYLLYFNLTGGFTYGFLFNGGNK